MGIADTDPTPICCLILASKVIRYRREGQAASSIPGTGLYNRAYYGVNLGDTVIDITMETRGREQVAELLDALTAEGYKHSRVL